MPPNRPSPRPALLVALVLAGLGLLGQMQVEARSGPPSFLHEDPGTEGKALATFAGGCFWCMESPFEKLAGVSRVISGYTGGHQEDPTYHQVCAGGTGHLEAIQVHYDPDQISYQDLLEVFWRQIDPTDPGGQFVDRGDQYRPAIFTHDPAQAQAAEESRTALAASKRFPRPITVEILPAATFYEAEPYHQDYYRTHPLRYQRYRGGSGRDRFLERHWGDQRHWKPAVPEAEAAPEFRKPNEAALRKTLTPLQFRVTQEEGTEPPFRNTYWDNKAKGLYLDVVSGEPLFSSREKYPSGTGWPSFFQPLEPENVVFRTDRHLGYARTEVRSKLGDSHLGHVFDDGPAPTGKRYCINSAALRFVPLEKLEEEGLERYRSHFSEGRRCPPGKDCAGQEAGGAGAHAGSGSTRRRAGSSLNRR